MKLKFFLVFFLANTSFIFAQHNNPQYKKINIEHYKLTISLNDSTNIVDATMEIQLQFKQNTPEFYLDLVGKDSISETGMQVTSVFQNSIEVDFKHTKNKLTILPKHNFQNLTYTYKIKYSGIPKDGLIISENIYGDKTFFGDNWPNRAHNWFPCIDHPSDKATVEFIITAPNNYQAIASGFMAEETNISQHLKLYHFKTLVPLPTKVMVLGVAKFAVQNLGEIHNIPVSTWVYPQTKSEGFHDFEIASKILAFFIEHIGEYPFQKLANVQSKTRFGGMENAGNIFYFEKSVTGKQEHEDLIAHEIVHQWFGNSASEIEWSHLWLSEGFATYLTDLYILEEKGEEAFVERLKKERNKVLQFYKQSPTPVVDGLKTDFLQLLNPNSYEKGGWFLHMLRDKIGNELFWKGIKEYYNQYKFSNASTNEFKKIISNVSNKNLDTFFNQWLIKTGHPQIKTSYIYHNNKLRLTVEQVQENTFEFPLEIELIYTNGTSEVKQIEVLNKNYSYEIDTKLNVKSINLDPNTKLLFEEVN